MEQLLPCLAGHPRVLPRDSSHPELFLRPCGAKRCWAKAANGAINITHITALRAGADRDLTGVGLCLGRRAKICCPPCYQCLHHLTLRTRIAIQRKSWLFVMPLSHLCESSHRWHPSPFAHALQWPGAVLSGLAFADTLLQACCHPPRSL